jgi:hypothetical protein
METPNIRLRFARVDRLIAFSLASCLWRRLETVYIGELILLQDTAARRMVDWSTNVVLGPLYKARVYDLRNLLERLKREALSITCITSYSVK